MRNRGKAWRGVGTGDIYIVSKSIADSGLGLSINVGCVRASMTSCIASEYRLFGYNALPVEIGADSGW